MSQSLRKHTFRHMRPTKIQISLRIRTVCAEYSLSSRRNFAYLAIQGTPCEVSDQTARMRRLIWIFARRKCPKARFLTLWLKSMWSTIGWIFDFLDVGIKWTTTSENIPLDMCAQNQISLRSCAVWSESLLGVLLDSQGYVVSSIVNIH